MANRLLPKSPFALPGTMVDSGFEPINFELPSYDDATSSAAPTQAPEPKKKVRVPVDAVYTMDDTGRQIIDPRYPYRYVEIDEDQETPDLWGTPDHTPDPMQRPVGWAFSKLPEWGQKALALPALIPSLPEMMFEASRAKQAELAPDTLGKPIEEVDPAYRPATMLARGLSHIYTMPWAMGEGVYHALTNASDVTSAHMGGTPVNERDLNLAMFDAASMAPLGVAGMKAGASALGRAADTGDVGMFAGRSAARNLEAQNRPGARMALDLAESLEKAGFTPDEIALAATDALRLTDPSLGGVSRGADGKWRFEIDDRAARLHPDYDQQAGAPALLGQVMDHPEFFAAYPELRELPANAGYSPNVMGAFDPSIDAQTGRMRPENISVAAPDEAGRRSALIHEGQHAAQAIEDFAPGANPNVFGGSPALRSEFMMPAVQYLAESQYGKRFQDLTREEQTTIARSAQNALYRQTAGEVEARNAQARADMTPEERRITDPELTEDVVRGNQVMFDPREMLFSNADDASLATAAVASEKVKAGDRSLPPSREGNPLVTGGAAVTVDARTGTQPP